MRLSVTQNTIEITEKGTLNQGEINATSCEFEFTGLYDGLTKKAIITDTIIDKAYEVPIVNDECDIPAEVLERKGAITIGVYAYEVTEGELILRYSPTPVRITVSLGSYRQDVENPSQITATQAETYEAAIQKKIEEVDAVVDDIKEKLADGSLRGEPGKDGENGKDGADGDDGAPGRDGKDGKDGAPGRDGVDGKNGEKGQDGAPGAPGQNGADGADGFSPTVDLQQIDETTARLTITDKNGAHTVTFGGLFANAEEEEY